MEIECREQGGQKVMCWCGVVDGKIIIHWFDQNVSVNGDTYLETLQNVVLPKIRALATRRRYWFQQDGASIHTTIRARAWLQSKFGSKVVSRLTARPQPKSPDLYPLDFWFWGVGMAELRRALPTTLEDLNITVEAFADSMDKEEITKAVRHLRTRAQVCKQLNGAAF